MLFFSDFLPSHGCHYSYVCVFHTVCVACATHISSSLDAAQSGGRGELTKTREVCLALSKLNCAPPRTATRGFVVRRR